MNDLLHTAAALSDKAGVPPEILTGLPVIELTGDYSVCIEGHRGISEYSQQAVKIKVKIGVICITGSRLRIRIMNRQKIILDGAIRALLFERNLQ